jgi:hypothetical protein
MLKSIFLCLLFLVVSCSKSAQNPIEGSINLNSTTPADTNLGTGVPSGSETGTTPAPSTGTETGSTPTPSTGSETVTITGTSTGSETGSTPTTSTESETGTTTGNSTGSETGSTPTTSTGTETGTTPSPSTGTETGTTPSPTTGTETGSTTGTSTGSETGTTPTPSTETETGTTTGTSTGSETGTTNELEDAIAEVSGSTNLNDIAQILEEEQNFTYQMNKIGPFDRISFATLQLNLKRANGTQDAIIRSQRRLSTSQYSGIEFTKVNIPTGETSKMLAPIYEPFYGIRAKYKEEDQFYVFTQMPIKIYKSQIPGDSSELITELFKESSIPITKRSLSKLAQYQNNICGLHPNSGVNIFFKDNMDTVTYMKTTQSVSQIFCVEKSVVIKNANGDFYLVTSEGERKIFSPLENSCSSIKTGYYQKGFHLLCYYTDPNGKTKYKPFLVDEEMIAAVEQPSIKGLPSSALPFLVKFDVVNNERLSSEALVYHRPVKGGNWEKLKVAVESNPKNILGVSLNQGELHLLSTYGMYRYANNEISKVSMAFHPKASLHLNGQNFVLSSSGAVSKIDPLTQTNDYFYALTKSPEVTQLNPTPFLSLNEKVSVLRSDVSNGAVHFFSKVGTVFKAYKHNIELKESNHLTFESGDIIIDMHSFGDKTAIIYKKADGTYLLSLYGPTFEPLAETKLTSIYAKLGRVSILKDGVVLNIRNEMIKFDFDLQIAWKKSISGVNSHRSIQLPSGNYLTVINDHVTLIHHEKGIEKQLHSLKNLGFSVVSDLVLDGTQLYINYQGQVVLNLKLPFAVVNLKDDF